MKYGKVVYLTSKKFQNKQHVMFEIPQLHVLQTYLWLHFLLFPFLLQRQRHVLDGLQIV